MNNEGTLDDLYLEWLYTNFIGSVSNKNPNSTYWKLAKQLYSTPFTWVIHDDKNRGEDGRELRREFVDACDIQDVEVNWLQLDCSVLEMMIGLCCRASFETGVEPGDWFWRLLDNLDLRSYNDRVFNTISMREVRAVIKRLLDRSYEQNGVGGLFPLNNAREDQTQVKLWYQLQAYILENHIGNVA